MTELTGSFKEILNKLKKDKKAFFTVILGITGMMLILLSELPLFSGGEKKEAKETESYYAQELEENTQRLISQIQGAGKVSVMLTYDTSEEIVWAKDIDSKSEGDGKSDTSEKHIIIDADSGETGLEIKVVYPKIRGVAVVCTGGDDPVVQSEIKALLSALFDIGSNRISIARRAEKE